MSDLLRQSLLFPFIQSIHILGLTVLVGTIALMDLRLLGIAMRRQAVNELAAGVAPWSLAGLFTVLATGPLLFWADIPRYLSNPAFLLKMVLFAAALACHFIINRGAVRPSAPARTIRQKLPAVLSLLLWIGVVVAGRAIADFDIRPE